MKVSRGATEGEQETLKVGRRGYQTPRARRGRSGLGDEAALEKARGRAHTCSRISEGESIRERRGPAVESIDLGGGQSLLNERENVGLVEVEVLVELEQGSDNAIGIERVGHLGVRDGELEVG